MNRGPLKFLLATALLGALAHTGAVVPYAHEGSKAAQKVVNNDSFQAGTVRSNISLVANATLWFVVVFVA